MADQRIPADYFGVFHAKMVLDFERKDGDNRPTTATFTATERVERPPNPEGGEEEKYPVPEYYHPEFTATLISGSRFVQAVRPRVEPLNAEDLKTLLAKWLRFGAINNSLQCTLNLGEVVVPISWMEQVEGEVAYKGAILRFRLD